MDILQRDTLRIEQDGKIYEIKGGGSGVTIDTEVSETSTNAVQNKAINKFIKDITDPLEADVEALDKKVEDLKLYKFPNATIIGNPVINNGQISGFTENDYLRFPFVVDLVNKTFEINIELTTGSDVNTQQNIFDSDFGFAFAIRNSRLVIAMSSNGQTWDIGESTGTHQILPNTAYKIKLTWDKETYKVLISTNGGESYEEDITKASNQSLYPKQVYIGVGTNHGSVLNHFTGIINFNDCNLYINDLLRWQGMDDVGISTRLARDLSNIDSTGEQKVRDIVGIDSEEWQFTLEDGSIISKKVVIKND